MRSQAMLEQHASTLDLLREEVYIRVDRIRVTAPSGVWRLYGDGTRGGSLLVMPQPDGSLRISSRDRKYLLLREHDYTRILLETLDFGIRYLHGEAE